MPPSAERDALLHGLEGMAGAVRGQHHRQPGGPRADARDHRGRGGAVRTKARARAAAHQRARRIGSRLAADAGHQPRHQPRRGTPAAARSTRFATSSAGCSTTASSSLVRLRNRFARALGFDNYFDLKLQKNERMSTAALLRLLDDFVRAHRRGQSRARSPTLRRRHGDASHRALEPALLSRRATSSASMDAYMPFGLALRRWIESFRRLGIQFRGATLQLDLLERTGKHQNGFCHGPVPAGSPKTGAGCRRRSTSRRKPSPIRSAAAFARSTRSSTKAATPRTSPTSCRTRPASRRNTRRRRWRTRKRSRCSATACSTTPTGSLRYASDAGGRADPGVARPRAHRQPSTDARVRRPLDCRRPLLRIGAVPAVRRRPDAGTRAGAGARNRACACSASRARGRCSPFRTCSTRNRRRRIRAICWRTWRSRRRARIFWASSAT